MYFTKLLNEQSVEFRNCLLFQFSIRFLIAMNPKEKRKNTLPSEPVTMADLNLTLSAPLKSSSRILTMAFLYSKDS